MKIKYKNLQSGDVVCCGGHGIIAGVIRWATDHRMFDPSVSTHTGIIIDLNGQKMIAEATPRGLKLNSLEEYIGNRKRFILGIYRKKGFGVEVGIAMDKDISLDLRRTIDYDYKGDVSFLITKLGNDPDKVFCSEYVALKYIHFVKWMFKTSKNNLSSPQDIYIDCRKEPFYEVDWSER